MTRHQRIFHLGLGKGKGDDECDSDDEEDDDEGLARGFASAEHGSETPQLAQPPHLAPSVYPSRRQHERQEDEPRRGECGSVVIQSCARTALPFWVAWQDPRPASCDGGSDGAC
jgi:hypothetical protein